MLKYLSLFALISAIPASQAFAQADATDPQSTAQEALNETQSDDDGSISNLAADTIPATPNDLNLEQQTVQSAHENQAVIGSGDEAIQAQSEDAQLASISVSEPYFVDEGWEDDPSYAEYEEDSTDYSLPAEISLPELPGKEINYKLKLHKYNHHDLHGRADSDVGKLRFKSKLMPSNEVKMDIKLKGEEEILFKAYLDLANYTMELDGGGAILSSEQKTMMQYTAEHLRQRLIKKFQDEIPDHSFMTVQLLTYWSKSPDGFRHIKRDVVSN